ncbi:MAG: hypothetical protein HRT68_09240 [Flavobacteriaceae bacterium]|nr:hypothetical protein [Flavobacteriaceae bacterium]
MYGLLNSEFIQSIEIQKAQIAESLNNDKLIHDKSVKLYDSLTTEYLKYLENTSSKLINNIKKQQSNFDGEFSKNTYVNNFFFEGEKCNKTGNEFISKLKKYRT